LRQAANGLANLRQQLLQYYIRNRTKSAVFEGDVGAFEQHIFVGVWKPLTVGRPHIVNAAGVVRSEAGKCFVEISTLPIY
jgi:hypothetical protein